LHLKDVNIVREVWAAGRAAAARLIQFTVSLEKLGKAGDFAVQNAEFAIDLLDLKLEGMAVGGWFGDEGLHGDANEFGDTLRTVGCVEGFQRFKFALGKAQTDSPAFSDS
jgi:hypothetical protein